MNDAHDDYAYGELCTIAESPLRKAAGIIGEAIGLAFVALIFIAVILLIVALLVCFVLVLHRAGAVLNQ